jgi:hypothetical protein
LEGYKDELMERMDITASLFSDVDLQASFREDGYVRIPLLNPQEVSGLKAIYDQLEGEPRTGFHASMFQPDRAYREKADAAIRTAIGRRLENILPGYAPLYANFMVKEPGPESEMKVHQDWTYVEEPGFTSLAIWFPLMDLDHHNGCLYMMRGNHRIPTPVRGPGTLCPYSELHETIRSAYSVKVPLKAGEAILWDHRVVHWSPPNLSEKPRIAATAILIPKGAQVIHYYRGDDYPRGEVEKFAVGRAFFMNYRIGIRPEGVPVLERTTYDEFLLEEKDIAFLKRTETGKKPGIFDKIRAIFS